MRSRMDARSDTFVCDDLAKCRVTVVLIGHILDEVRQLVAGVDSFEVRRVVNVITRVHEPVGVKDHDGVDAQRSTAARDLVVTVNSGLTTSFMGAI